MLKQIIAVLLIGAVQAFAPPTSHSVRSSISQQPTQQYNTIPTTSTTALAERQWNFNDGRGPWGMKKNAEIWNGRVAQMAFVVVLLQEAITGKGVIASIQDGDLVGIAFLGFAGVSTLALTAWLAIKGDENSIKF
ncbi:hypothetical protein ACHAWT_003297 [Skeletonema menzelii]|mmetsp:Transcript_17541/g.28701  ORF Transcript_17541/g.28701 Transcript_17541/m.28701 type:complete len:135 (-) Transcript_17541:196-600(-)|eukprot:scaffold14392_cov151-Skeletonema_menzelii.AAC.14